MTDDGARMPGFEQKISAAPAGAQPLSTCYRGLTRLGYFRAGPPGLKRTASCPDIVLVRSRCFAIQFPTENNEEPLFARKRIPDPIGSCPPKQGIELRPNSA
jgi:hypothetical protein